MTHRVIIHPGFHKTGTSTAQRLLQENRALVWKSHALALNWRIRDMLHASRGYSTWRDEASLLKFSIRFAEFIAGLDMPGDRGLVMSAEELAGHLPGREKVPDYGALPDLMRAAAQVLEEAFGDSLELTFLMTTRAPDPWLDSAWAEHVKASRMVHDLDAFRARFAPAADLGGMVERLREAVAPHRVVVAALEDIKDAPLGPAQPLIDLLQMPPQRYAQIVPVETRNARLAPEVLAEMLRLNRSELDQEALLDAKKAVLNAHYSR